MRFGVVDTIVREPLGGAHRDPQAAIEATGEAIAEAFASLAGMDADAVKKGAPRQIPGHRRLPLSAGGAVPAPFRALQ